MAREVVTGAASVDAYLADVADRLRGPRQRRHRILAELRDGLELAVEEQTPSAEAATRAIAQFGRADAVARAFAGELATAWARRTVGRYIVTGPLVGLWWLLLFHAVPWRIGAVALLLAIPALPLIVLAIATALGIVATTGRLMRWLPEIGPHRALAAVLVVVGLVLAGDLTMVAVFARSSLPLTQLAIVAVAASVVRVAGSVVVVRHALGTWRSVVAARAVEDDDGRA
jgi:hypothetical protein